MPSRPSHFEIPVDDPDRAEKFYAAVFGWTFQRYDGAPSYYGMASTGDTDPGINGALFQRDTDSETTITMSVVSIEDTIATILAEGGKVLQDKAAIPSMGWFAVCQDTEGNKFGLYTNDPSATMPTE
jgi:predicted enzyme related to lactoylglutathione lyase